MWPFYLAQRKLNLVFPVYFILSTSAKEGDDVRIWQRKTKYSFSCLDLQCQIEVCGDCKKRAKKWLPSWILYYTLAKLFLLYIMQLHSLYFMYLWSSCFREVRKPISFWNWPFVILAVLCCAPVPMANILRTFFVPHFLRKLLRLHVHCAQRVLFLNQERDCSLFKICLTWGWVLYWQFILHSQLSKMSSNAFASPMALYCCYGTTWKRPVPST